MHVFTFSSRTSVKITVNFHRGLLKLLKTVTLVCIILFLITVVTITYNYHTGNKSYILSVLLIRNSNSYFILAIQLVR